mmetsp:Transcript_38008/g.95229  ORF Transcript_38008/g.95229 Transcript_38008/m.95229 type:complete len:208 (-) Transcript_38008:650-1273(-)
MYTLTSVQVRIKQCNHACPPPLPHPNPASYTPSLPPCLPLFLGLLCRLAALVCGSAEVLEQDIHGHLVQGLEQHQPGRTRWDGRGERYHIKGKQHPQQGVPRQENKLCHLDCSEARLEVSWDAHPHAPQQVVEVHEYVNKAIGDLSDNDVVGESGVEHDPAEEQHGGMVVDVQEAQLLPLLTSDDKQSIGQISHLQPVECVPGDGTS